METSLKLTVGSTNVFMTDALVGRDKTYVGEGYAYINLFINGGYISLMSKP